MLEKRLSPALTVRRHVDLAFHGQEIKALPFALELARELLGRDSLQVRDGAGDLTHLRVVLLHKDIFLLITEIVLAAFKVRNTARRIR